MADKVISAVNAAGITKDIHDARIPGIDQVPTSGSQNSVRSKDIIKVGNALADKIIKSASDGTTDLSTLDINGNPTFSINTANTYVITSPGTYKIPVVYGNGIKNGEPNPDAYTLKVPDDSPRTTWYGDFINYLGNKITSPYIETDTNHTATSAVLLWQTFTNIVTNVTVAAGTDCSEVIVNIGRIPKTNGVAVVAVKDENGDIMWSWTLWTVSDKNDLGETNITGRGYDLTISTNQFTRVDSVVPIMSNSSLISTVLNRPLCSVWNSDKTQIKTTFYNYGRKDAFPPEDFVNSGNFITVYDINGNTVSINTLGTMNDRNAQKTVANAIKMPTSPFVSYEANGTWANTYQMTAFWNNQGHLYSTSAMLAEKTENTNSIIYDGIATNANLAVKTIYDPCPYGYMVPTSLVFNGFFATDEFVITKQTITNNNTTVFRLLGGWDHGLKFRVSASDNTGYLIPENGMLASGTGKPISGYTYGQYLYSVVQQNAGANTDKFIIRTFNIQKTTDTSFTISTLESDIPAVFGGIIPMKDWSV